jgi:hypothetical protein
VELWSLLANGSIAITVMAVAKWRRMKMGEYECVDCNAVFHLEEPPFDGSSLCDDCRTVIKFPSLSDLDRQLIGSFLNLKSSVN